MSDLANTIVALATLVTAIGAVVIGYRNSLKAEAARERASEAVAAAEAAKVAASRAEVDIIATRNGVFEVGKQIDGRLSELLELTKAAAYAEGKLAGEQGGK